MDDNKRRLYDALSSEYDMGTFEQFVSDIKDDAKRKRLYDAVSTEYDLGDYDSFSKQLFQGEAQQIQAPTSERTPNYTATTGDYTQPTEAQRNFEERGNFEPIGQGSVELKGQDVPVLVGAQGQFRVPSPVKLDEQQEIFRHGNPSEAEVREYTNRAKSKQAKETDEERRILTEEIDSRIADRLRRYEKEVSMPAGGVSGGMVGVPQSYFTAEADEEVRVLRAAQDLMNQSRIKRNKYRRKDDGFASNVMSSMGEKAIQKSTWDFGATDMNTALQLYKASEKEDRGEELTENEQLLMDAAVNNAITQAVFEAESKGAFAGEMAVDMIPFVMQIVANPISGLGKAASSKVSQIVAKRILRMPSGAIRRIAMKVAPRGAALVAGLPTDLAAGAGMAVTTNAMNTAADALHRMEEGERTGEAVTKAILNQGIEFASENTGRFFSPLFNGIGKMVGKGVSKITPNAVINTAKDIANKGYSRQFKELLKAGRWDGFLEENAEEIAGGLMNAALVGDRSVEEVFSKDNLIDTAIGLSVAGVLLPAVATGKYIVTKFKERGKALMAEKEAAAVFGDRWPQFRQAITEAKNSDSLGDAIAGLYQAEGKNMSSSEETKALYDFARAYYAYNALKGINPAGVSYMSDEYKAVVDNITAGETMTPEELQVASMEANRAIEELARMTGMAADELAGIGVEDALNRADEAEVNGDMELAGLWRSYIQSAANLSGNERAVKNQIEQQSAASDAEVDALGNNGRVVSATLKSGEEVFVVGGNVVLNGDGSINEEASDKQLIVVLDGERKTIGIASIGSVDGSVSVDEEKARRRAAIEEEARRQQMIDRGDVHVFTPGETFSSPMGEVQFVEDNGDGTASVTVNGSNTVVSMEELNNLYSQAKQVEYNASKRAEGEKGSEGEKVDEESVPAEAAVPVGPEKVASEETAALSPAEQRKQKRAEVAKRIPTEGKKRLWTMAKPEDVAEYISLLESDPAKQAAMVDGYLAEIAEKQAKLSPIEAAELNEDVEFWNGVKGLLGVETENVARENNDVSKTEGVEAEVDEPTENVSAPAVEDVRAANEMKPAEELSGEANDMVEGTAAESGYTLSELTDNDGNRFYQKNGSIDLWDLSPLFEQARRQKAPIRLTERNVNHILDEHKKELGDSEKSVIDFLDDIFSNARVLRKARAGGIFVVVDNTKTDKAAIIRLYPSKNGDYYNVESAGYYRKNKWKDTEYVIAELSEPTQSVTASDVSKPQVPEEGGRELLNAETATTSVAKDTPQVSNEQENEQKSGEIGNTGVNESVSDNAEVGSASQVEEETSNGSTISQESEQVGEQDAGPVNGEEVGEKDIYNRLKQEFEERQNARYKMLPIPRELEEAYRNGNTEAIKEWEEKWNAFLQGLVPMDLFLVDGTIRTANGRKGTVLKKNDKGRSVVDKDSATYKAWSYIESTLKKSKKELEKILTDEDRRNLDIISRGVRGELQQGSLSLDTENPAFEAATKNTVEAVKKTGVEVEEATPEMVQAVLGGMQAEKQIVEATNERFNRELDAFKEKKHSGLLHLGAPMGVLSAAGVNARELTLSPTVLHQHLKKHNLTTDDLKGLAEAIQSPILVYRHGETRPNLVVVTELNVNGGKLSIALKLDANGNVVEVSNVSSVHSKDGVKELERLSLLDENKLRDYLRWVEKEKVSDWLGLPYEEERQDANPKLVSVANVINSFENPKIETEFLRTSDGTVYGWAVNGKIFLTPEGMNPNTPAHEYTHLWASMIEKNDPKLWSRIVEVMKESPTWNEVLLDEAYRDIHNNDSRMASEVLSRLSGEENYRRAMELAEREIKAADGIIEKAKKIALWGRIKQALADFWASVKGVFGFKDKAPWTEFVDMALGDLYAGVNPNAVGSPLERMFIGERGAANLDMAEEASLRLDNLNVAEDDILMRSPGQSVAQTLYDKETAGVVNDFVEGWQNRYRSLQALMNAIEKETGKKIADFANVFLNMEHLPARNRVKMDSAMRKYVEPLMAIVNDFAKMGVSQKELERYLNSKHGLERNREMAVADACKSVDADGKAVFDSNKFSTWEAGRDAIYAQGMSWADTEAALDALAKTFGVSLSKDYSGLTAIYKNRQKGSRRKAAYDAVVAFESKAGNELIDELWKRVKAINDFSLSESFSSGLMAKDTYDRLTKRYRYYVPLRGFNEKAVTEYEYVSSTDFPMQSINKTAHGRRSEAADIFPTMMNMMESAVVLGNRNRAKLALLHLAEQYPTKLLTVSNSWYSYNDVNDTWVPVAHPQLTPNMTPEEIADTVNKWETDMRELEKQGKAKRFSTSLQIDKLGLETWKQDEHSVKVRRNGKEYVVWVNGNPKAAQAINGILGVQSQDTSKFFQLSERANRWRANNITSRNPEFVFSNLARDVQQASKVSFIKFGFKYLRDFERNLWRNSIPKIHRLYYLYSKDKLNMNDPTHKMFYEFMQAGSETGFITVMSIEDYQKKIDKLVSPTALDKAGKPIKVVRDTFNTATELANRGVENACRFAAFMTSRQAGRSLLESVNDAKEVSLNFDRKGSGAYGNMEARQMKMFLNPTIQGLAQQITLIKEHPARAIPVTMAELAMGYFAGQAAVYLFNWIASLFTGDDDEKYNYSYYNIPEFVRRNSLIIPTGREVNDYIVIPLSHEQRVAYGIGEILGTFKSGHMDAEDVPTAIMAQAAQMLPMNPFDAEAFIDPNRSAWENFIKTVSPDILVPGLEAVFFNENFAGMRITNQSDYNKHLPEYKRALKDTPKYMVELSKFINEASGGTSGKKGWADSPYTNNPAVWEHLMKSYLGGIYAVPNKATKTVLGFWDEDFREPKNWPIIGKFYMDTSNYEQSPEERTRRDYENAYYKIKDKYEAVAKELTTYRKELVSTDEEVANEARKNLETTEGSIYNSRFVGYFKSVEKMEKRLKDALNEAKESKEKELVDELEQRLLLLKKEAVNYVETLEELNRQ